MTGDRFEPLAHDANRRKVVLATIRQDLSAPVSAILEYAGMLRDDFARAGLDACVADMDKVVTAARQLMEIANGFLDKDVAETLFQGGDLEATQRKLRHDLRTPINAIKGYSEMLLEDLQDEGRAQGELVEDLAKLIAEADSLLAQLPTIVDFSRYADDRDASPAGTQAQQASPQDIATSISRSVDYIDSRKNRRIDSGRILVVDDLRTNRELLQRRLTRDQHTVSLAQDGYEALRLVGEQPFDLILLDLMMPGINGYEVLMRLKQPDSPHRDIPVVMISAMDEVDAVIRCIELGADDYLSKPFNPVLLQARIQSSLEKKFMRDRERQFLQQIQQEKEKSEKLLLNILPGEIVSRLNTGESLIADNFESVSVLFSDLVGFTSISSRIKPADLVKNLNEIFCRFDQLAADLGVEKLKTIGDAYIVVSGLPVPRADHARALADMALGMVRTLQELSGQLDADFQIRIGIHSGPVAAGIIGSHKFVYDIWGDTVNVASRLESLSIPNRIHISEETANLLGEGYRVQPRGSIPVKGKGVMNTYFLNERVG